MDGEHADLGSPERADRSEGFGERLLGALLDRSHTTPPHLIAPLIAEEIETIGGRDALLVPPLSAQALGILRRDFPSARLIVAEFDDPESGTWIPGPITRAMAAGADAYLTPGTLGDLAVEVRVVIEGRDDRALPSGSRQTRGEPELEA